MSQLQFRLRQHRAFLESAQETAEMKENMNVAANPELAQMLTQDVLREQAVLSLQ